MAVAHFVDEPGLRAFVDALVGSWRVVAPVAKRGKFSFEELSSADELRLDYDVTILPPKKVFFPPAQPIVRFSEDEVSSCTSAIDTVLLGVHFYDVKAIDQLDFLMAENNADADYLCQRDATTIVASNIQAVSPRAFWDSVGTHVQPQGHDAFLTKIGGGYVLETRTEKGEALIGSGAFREASEEEIAEAREVNEAVMGTCPERLTYTSEEIAERVRDSFGDEKMWDKLAERCFSCGSCNTVCPTCYCFDVVDSWNLDQKSGTRTRYWDACLTREFAAVTGAGGSKENFREHHSSRFRHRFMRKTTYLNEKLGGPACVGCGRCSQACTADIADPVRVITTIMERTS
ncbi:MAG: 4Fe-4S dicluster domain-containing protein [Coriobacteriia bacterium]|nr:4Fe-4S dicluster domain-containing protein [Coriobacteriia bacterium]